MRELDRYSGSVVADRDRVHWAILKLTDGSLENLKHWIEIALAEYSDASTATDVRHFNTWSLDPATVAEISPAALGTDSKRKP